MSHRLRSLVAGLSAATLASFGPGCSHMPAKGEPSPDDCAGARSQRTVGTVLGLTGAAALGTGVGLVATTSNPPNSWPDAKELGGGAAIAVGAVLTLVGVGIAGAPSTAIYRCKAAGDCRSGRIDACNLLKEPPP